MRRAAIYSLVGFGAEVIFSAVHDALRGRRIHFRTSPWMIPIYATIEPLYEPMHDALRELPREQRGAAYAAGFLAVEYASGALIRSITGTEPWDHSHARLNVNGLIRLDYAPYWAAAGLALEPLHDLLVGRSPGSDD